MRYSGLKYINKVGNFQSIQNFLLVCEKLISISIKFIFNKIDFKICVVVIHQGSTLNLHFLNAKLI